MIYRHRWETIARSVGTPLPTSRYEEVDMRMPEWFDKATCSTTDPESFFPTKGEQPNSAKRVCSRCPVRRDCLQFALDNAEPYGIWGGLTERERRALRKVAV